MARIRIGIIDLGTNSVRFDVHEISEGKAVKTLHRERLMVRLGNGVFVNGKMDSRSIARTVEAFASFRYTADRLHVQKIVAIATSAVRQASDRGKLVQAIKKRAGITLRVISGQEEARLIAKGIISNEKKLPSAFVLIDVGGGSTELSLCKKGKPSWSQSFPVGSARIDQLFNLSDPTISPKTRLTRIQELRTYIRKSLDEFPHSREPKQVKILVGSSGTIKALAKLKSAGAQRPTPITLAFMRKSVRTMSRMTRTRQTTSAPAGSDD